MKKLILAMSVFTLTFLTSCTNESNEPIQVQQEKTINKTVSKDGGEEIIYYTDENPLAQEIANDMARSTGLDVGTTTGKCKTTASWYEPVGGITHYHVVCGSVHWTVNYANGSGWSNPIQEDPRLHSFWDGIK